MFYDYDVDILAKTVYGEARGESPEGQLAVSKVIINRASRRGFVKTPNVEGSIAAVCLAPYQFSCWNHDDPNYAKLLTLNVTDELKKIPLEALNTLEDITHGADHYYASSIPAPYWTRGMRQTAVIGHHIFFNSLLTPKSILYFGSVNDYVRKVQVALGVTPDGVYGPQTYEAVKAFQASHGLVVDGIVGDQTYERLGI